MLGVYLVVLGRFFSRVLGFSDAGCPVGQPCDPLPMHRFDRLGTTLLVLGVAMIPLTLVILAMRTSTRSPRSLALRLPTSRVSRAVVSLVAALAAALVVALGVAVLVFIWNSPITCEGGGDSSLCPPSRVLSLVLLIIGGNLVAVILLIAARGLNIQKEPA